MTYPIDILGRPPVMRPGAKGAQEARPALRCEDRQGRTVVYVPCLGQSGPDPVTLPTLPWEDAQWQSS